MSAYRGPTGDEMRKAEEERKLEAVLRRTDKLIERLGVQQSICLVLFLITVTLALAEQACSAAWVPNWLRDPPGPILPQYPDDSPGENQHRFGHEHDAGITQPDAD